MDSGYGAAKMADTPEIFDVIVMENLYGDILSDVAAQITVLLDLQDLQM
jgi:isocitrate/isopropylmalate dehydrogenase